MNNTDIDNRFLTFSIAGELYGTPLLAVREVVEYQEPKFIPNMARHFSGVINIRGTIVGVVDMRNKFVGKFEDKQSKKAMLICETEQGPLAAIVDQVESVISVDDGSIEKNPPIQVKFDQKYLIGIAKYKDKLITLINLLQTLAEDKISAA